MEGCAFSIIWVIWPLFLSLLTNNMIEFGFAPFSFRRQGLGDLLLIKIHVSTIRTGLRDISTNDTLERKKNQKSRERRLRLVTIYCG